MKIPVLPTDAMVSLPAGQHPGDAGADLTAAEPVDLAPGERALVPTGFSLAIPSGYAGFVLPRSGLAVRSGITVINAPGLIDSGYRGEVRVGLVNLSSEAFRIERGDRIAQLVIMAIGDVEYVEVERLDDTLRGDGGFGSTGTATG